ncbi:MAG: hypothetical protein H6566_10235 [Lewinellaceae bacterium]|nr:hypothetical protein [Lewinellaceae bacterium]
MISRYFLLEKITEKQAAANSNMVVGIQSLSQILLSLCLISLAIYGFHLEQDIRLVQLMPFVAVGFAANALLPGPWRLPFLFLINLAAIFILLGIWDGALLAGIGLLLFYLANLPIAVKYRIGIVLLAGVVLAALRAEWLPFIQSKAVLAILGSMFMFRMIVYLYEMQFEKQPAGFWKKLNYFFLLPNLVFVIFPVVDYSTFVRNYYSRPAYETYRRGVLMMANGVFHLLLYRLIYYYLLPTPGEVQDIYGLLQYMAASYALIVRLAGIFHFSAGVICLFGFHLPPTFDHYFFANSFSDLWRRINIYWRDFVTKVFYFPIYFRLKRYGATFGLALSVLLVFFINWFLHGYQWFWIRGAFPLTIQDAVFWGVFGVLVAANSVIQSKRKSNQPRPGAFSAFYALRNAFKVLGIFTFMIVLWSFWTSQSIADWWAMVGKARSAGIKDGLVIGLGVFILAGAGLLLQYINHLYGLKKLPIAPSIRRTYWLANAGMASLVILGLPFVQQGLEQRLAVGLEPVYYTKLNAFDREQLYKGYYETLLAGNNLNSRMWELEQVKPEDWKSFSDLGISRRRNDIMMKELLPNESVLLKGGRFSTNSHGFRDQEYALEKPANTLRFALLGGSIEMGTGVSNEETYENLLEARLNSDKVIFGGQRVEILNFGLAGFHLFQDIAILEEKAAPFQPDVVLFTTHSNESFRVLASILQAYWTKRELTYPFLQQVIDEAAFGTEISQSEAMEKLKSREQEIITWGYDRIVQYCLDNNAIPVWVFVPTLDDNTVEGEEASLQQLAESRGFYTLNLSATFQGQDADALKIAPWDYHPNAEGHALIATELLKQLEENGALKERLRGKEK